MRRPSRPRIGLAMTAAVVLACNQAPPEEIPPAPPAAEETPDTVRDQVLAVVEQYYDDFSAREWDRFLDHFWPGATLTTPWQPPDDSVVRVIATRVEDFVEQAPLGPGSRAIFEERMDSSRVRGSANLAQVWAWYSARFGDPGIVSEWSGVDAFTLVRHEGRWRIAALVYVSDSGGPQ